eukprot:UC4_evm3s392
MRKAFQNRRWWPNADILLSENRSKIIFSKGNKKEKYSQKKRGTKHYKSYEFDINKENDVLFGIGPCEAALVAKRRHVERIWFQQGHGEKQKRLAALKFLAMNSYQNAKIEIISRHGLNDLTRGALHQGVAMDCSKISYTKTTATEFLERSEHHDKCPVILVAEGLSDPMNLGALIRSSSYFGASLVVSESHTCPLTPVVCKASAGTMESANLFSTPSLVDFVRELKALGYYAVATDRRGSNLLTWKGEETSSSLRGLIVAIGSERGMSNQLKQSCDELLAIPQPLEAELIHNVESLNVSVAVGIFLHHLEPHILNLIECGYISALNVVVHSLDLFLKIIHRHLFILNGHEHLKFFDAIANVNQFGCKI